MIVLHYNEIEMTHTEVLLLKIGMQLCSIKF